jgi:hypothetical protein
VQLQTELRQSFTELGQGISGSRTRSLGACTGSLTAVRETLNIQNFHL